MRIHGGNGGVGGFSVFGVVEAASVISTARNGKALLFYNSMVQCMF